MPDYDRRTTVVLIRNILGIAGSAAAFFAGFSYFFRATDEFANGQLNAAAYPAYAVAMVVLMVVCILVCVFGTRRQISYLNVPRVERAFHITDIYKDVLMTLQSPSFRRRRQPHRPPG